MPRMDSADNGVGFERAAGDGDSTGAAAGAGRCDGGSVRLQAKTKIVATLGPATDDLEVLRKMVAAGMSVARLNMSHGEHMDHARRIRMLREVADAEGTTVAVLMDLQGPRLRIGQVSEGVELEAGRHFILDADGSCGSATRVGISYIESVAASLRPGQPVLIDDGRIELRVVRVDGHRIETTVEEGGPLSSRKGINLPNSRLDIDSPTAKDRADVDFGLEHGVDWIALSFVASAEQVTELKDYIAQRGGDVPVIAKIERAEAIDEIKGILESSDGLMVARGDLALEIGAAKVPYVQKDLISRSNQAGVPVITATQMLESMVRSPLPTRAETSDVANAVYDGSDAVMLSGETAIGKYPVRAVTQMVRIAAVTEEHLSFRALGRRGAGRARRSLDGAISEAAVEIARRANASAIIAVTSSGATARAASVHRPEMPLIGATHRRRTCRRLALIWGVIPISVGNFDSTDEMVRGVLEAVHERGIIGARDRVVVTSGAPIGRPGTTNMLQVRQYGDWLPARGEAASDPPGGAGTNSM